VIDRRSYGAVYKPHRLLMGVVTTPRQRNLACCAAVAEIARHFSRHDDDEILRLLTRHADNPGHGPVPHMILKPRLPPSLYLDRLNQLVTQSLVASRPFPLVYYTRFLSDLDRCLEWHDPDLLAPVLEAVQFVIGNPFDPSPCLQAKDPAVTAIARQMREDCDFTDAPILADALEDAGSDDERLLARLRDPATKWRLGDSDFDSILGLPRASVSARAKKPVAR
jgi:hypothetical protein